MNLAIALRGAIVMIFVGASLGLAHNALSPDPVPWKPIPKTTLSLEDLVPNDPGVAGGETGGEVATGSLEDEGSLETEGGGGKAEAEKAVEPVTEPANDAAHQTESETGSAGAASGADYSDIPESQFPIEILLAKAKEFYDRGGLLVLDARDLDEYESGHIKNAESAPFDDKVADVDWLERTAAYPHPVLVYCDGTDCELSLNLGFEISQTGHPRVLVLKDGFGAWADAGYPTATGDHP